MSGTFASTSPAASPSPLTIQGSSLSGECSASGSPTSFWLQCLMIQWQVRKCANLSGARPHQAMGKANAKSATWTSIILRMGNAAGNLVIWRMESPAPFLMLRYAWQGACKCSNVSVPGPAARDARRHRTLRRPEEASMNRNGAVHGGITGIKPLNALQTPTHADAYDGDDDDDIMQ